MKFALIILLFSSVCVAADRIAPKVESIDPDVLLPALHAKEDFRSHAVTIRRGLVGTQLAYRAESAQWFIKHGTVEDVPFLIDSLSDDSRHVGATYALAGMTTARRATTSSGIPPRKNESIRFLCGSSIGSESSRRVKNRRTSRSC